MDTEAVGEDTMEVAGEGIMGDITLEGIMGAIITMEVIIPGYMGQPFTIIMTTTTATQYIITPDIIDTIIMDILSIIIDS